MKNRFARLLDTRGLATEDDTTAALADGLSNSSSLLLAFLEFLFSGSKLPSLTIEALEVRSQYRFSAEVGKRADVASRGRIDLAIIDRKNSIFVGVEFKVRDGENPARLHNYRLLMQAEGFKRDFLFGLVQKRQHDFSQVETVDSVHTWNEFNEYLLYRAGLLQHSLDRPWIEEFCAFLLTSSTLVAKGHTASPQSQGSTGRSKSELAALLAAC